MNFHLLYIYACVCAQCTSKDTEAAWSLHDIGTFMLLNCFVFHFQTMFDNSFWRENIKFNQNSYLKMAYLNRTEPNRRTVRLTKLNRLLDCVIWMKSLLVNAIFFIFRLWFKWEIDWRRNFIGIVRMWIKYAQFHLQFVWFEHIIYFCCCFIDII